jgi:hypothetical protein
MIARILRLIVGIVIVLTAWTVGRLQGQPQVAEFEIKIEAPFGKTTVACYKGCNWETWFSCRGQNNAGTCPAIIDQNGLVIRHGNR